MSVLLERLVPHLPDPFKVLGVERDTDFDQLEPQVEYVDNPLGEPNTRDTVYSMKRIRYFRDLFREGKDVSPIVLDNQWHGFRPTGLVLDDGHHRLCGAILAGSDVVNVDYSGDTKALRWLKGEIQNPPDWMED